MNVILIVIYVQFCCCQGDGAERVCEERHHSSHQKFVETIRKIYSKLQVEEEKYKDRLEELEVEKCLFYTKV